MSMYTGAEVYLHTFFNTDATWRWVVTVIHRPVDHRERNQAVTEQEAGWVTAHLDGLGDEIFFCTFQPITRKYTNYATLVPTYICTSLNCLCGCVYVLLLWFIPSRLYSVCTFYVFKILNISRDFQNNDIKNYSTENHQNQSIFYITYLWRTREIIKRKVQ